MSGIVDVLKALANEAKSAGGGELLKDFISQVRVDAKSVGKACDVAVCDALCLGTRCEKCLRRTCPAHTLWVLTPKPVPYCPLCVLFTYRDLFSE